MSEQLVLFEDSEKEIEKGNEKHLRSYIPSFFITAALPIRAIKKNVFERKYNNISMSLHSVRNVPYGLYGRLVLSLLCTHAVLNKNSRDEIELKYESMSELLRELQLPRQRGKDIQEQLNNFVDSTMVYKEKQMKRVSKDLFGDLYEEKSGQVDVYKYNTGSINFIDSLEYIELEDVSGKEGKNSVSFRITVNEKFAKLCQEHSVPIDYTVYKEISSALGKDLYAWFIYRNNFLKENEQIFIPRSSLVKQFYPTDNKEEERGNFARIKEQIRMIQEKYYPGLKVWIEKDNIGITLKKSPEVIKSNDTRYILVSSSVEEE